MSFDEQSLRRDIAETWGEHGAHIDVFDALVKSRAAVIDQKVALIEEIDRLRQLITTWADAEDLLEYDVDDPWSDLRKAVGR